MLKILVAGGTGLIGSNLITKLKQKNYNVILLSTQKDKADDKAVFYWQPYKNEIPGTAIKDVDICINLCGAGIFDRRFSDQRKKELTDSRVIPTKALYEAFSKSSPGLKHYIAGSASGIYPNICSYKLNEDSTKGVGFIPGLVKEWENAALQFESICKTTIIRTGIVFSDKGGFLKQLATPVKLFAGAVPGSGKQVISWIHIDDWSGMAIHIIEKKLSGIFNASASAPETLQTITRQIAKAVHRPLFLPNIPVFALKLMFGKRHELLLTSQDLSNDKIKGTGFHFKYETSEQAIQNLLAG
jgi:uncharacterized protein (TIGR01777 family)